MSIQFIAIAGAVAAAHTVRAHVAHDAVVTASGSPEDALRQQRLRDAGYLEDPGWDAGYAESASLQGRVGKGYPPVRRGAEESHKDELFEFHFAELDATEGAFAEFYAQERRAALRDRALKQRVVDAAAGLQAAILRRARLAEPYLSAEALEHWTAKSARRLAELGEILLLYAVDGAAVAEVHVSTTLRSLEHGAMDMRENTLQILDKVIAEMEAAIDLVTEEVLSQGGAAALLPKLKLRSAFLAASLARDAAVTVLASEAALQAYAGQLPESRKNPAQALATALELADDHDPLAEQAEQVLVGLRRFRDRCGEMGVPMRGLIEEAIVACHKAAEPFPDCLTEPCIADAKAAKDAIAAAYSAWRMHLLACGSVFEEVPMTEVEEDLKQRSEDADMHQRLSVPVLTVTMFPMFFEHMVVGPTDALGQLHREQGADLDPESIQHYLVHAAYDAIELGEREMKDIAYSPNEPLWDYVGSEHALAYVRGAAPDELLQSPHAVTTDALAALKRASAVESGRTVLEAEQIELVVMVRNAVKRYQESAQDANKRPGLRAQLLEDLDALHRPGETDFGADHIEKIITYILELPPRTGETVRYEGYPIVGAVPIVEDVDLRRGALFDLRSFQATVRDFLTDARAKEALAKLLGPRKTHKYEDPRSVAATQQLLLSFVNDHVRINPAVYLPQLEAWFSKYVEKEDPVLAASMAVGLSKWGSALTTFRQLLLRVAESYPDSRRPERTASADSSGRNARRTVMGKEDVVLMLGDAIKTNVRGLESRPMPPMFLPGDQVRVLVETAIAGTDRFQTIEPADTPWPLAALPNRPRAEAHRPVIAKVLSCEPTGECKVSDPRSFEAESGPYGPDQLELWTAAEEAVLPACGRDACTVHRPLAVFLAETARVFGADIAALASAKACRDC